MKNRSFATLGILALLAAGSAFGQQKLRYDIPFEFHFADAVMPAGQYDVDMTANNVQHLLAVDCRNCDARAFSLTYPIGGGNNEPNEGRLVFNKYGDTYFLSQVWTPGYSQGGALNKSKTEHEIARITSPAQTSQVIMARR
jgi:hypothetical protein